MYIFERDKKVHAIYIRNSKVYWKIKYWKIYVRLSDNIMY